MLPNNECIKRLLYSRLRILDNYPFYGLLLMHMKYGLDDTVPTAYTDSERICFSPIFLEQLNDVELDFIMMHEILHVVLKHCFRGLDYDQYKFNIACDIVVNSNIMHTDSKFKNILIGGVPPMHIVPNKRKEEGYLYTAEEVYQMIIKNGEKSIFDDSWDIHDKWTGADKEHEEELNNLIVNIANTTNTWNKGQTLPEGVERLLKDLTNTNINWKNLLEEFLTYDPNDYSYNKADYRYSDDFFMPSYSELEGHMEDIYFFIDTSGSIDDDKLSVLFSCINDYITQFQNVNAKLCFFDTRIYGPYQFSTNEELMKIKPVGGGGTNFHIIFNYLAKETNKKAIVILTDGYANFPDESAALGVPVFWLINDSDIIPPWGMYAKIV